MKEVYEVYNELMDVLNKNVKYKKDKMLLLESYRRYIFFEKGNLNRPLNEAWVGLGYASQYKSIYFKPVLRIGSELQPRINYWWKLTDEGINVINEMLKIPINTNLEELNTYLFDK